MPEDRSDEQATTKEFPYPPNPSPERDKVEEMTAEAIVAAYNAAAPEAREKYWAGECAKYIGLYHASEKRAEGAEEHARTVIEVARNSCRQYERERDEARAAEKAAVADGNDLSDMTRRAIARENKIQIERDSARSSLARVAEETMEKAIAVVEGFSGQYARDIAKAIRSSLHRSQGE